LRFEPERQGGDCHRAAVDAQLGEITAAPATDMD
jgi:hypothetical protein